MSKMTTCLWFDKGQAREAAEFYASVFPDSHVGAGNACHLALHRLRGRHPFAEACRCRVALVHRYLGRRRAAPGVADDLRQQGGQTHVAADLQAGAGEQFFDVGGAAHDAEEVTLGHLDGDVRGAVPAGTGAAAVTHLRPEGPVLAEDELENAFDAHGMGVGEQFAEDALKVHGMPLAVFRCAGITSACTNDLAVWAGNFSACCYVP